MNIEHARPALGEDPASEGGCRPDGQQPFGGGRNAPEPPPPRGPKDAAPPGPLFGTAPEPASGRIRCERVWRMVQEEMRERRLTLNQVSRESGVARQTLGNYRDGKTGQPASDVVDRLCAYFGWGDLDEVLRWGMTEQRLREASDRSLAQWLVGRGWRPEDLDDPGEPEHLRELDARLKELMVQGLATQRTSGEPIPAAPNHGDSVVVWERPGNGGSSDPSR